MPLSSATITFDIADMLGVDYDTRRGIRAWVDTNIPGDTVVDTDGNKIRLGSGKVVVNADGTGTASVWIPGTGSNPASWQTYFHFEYVDTGDHKKGRQTRTFGPFTVTASGDLADLIAEQEIPPNYASGIIGQMQDLRDAAEAARDQAVEIAAGDLTGTFARTSIPTYAVGHPGVFDPAASLYNATPATLHGLRSKIAATINSRVKLAFIGHSMLAGSKASPGATDTPFQVRGLLSVAGVPIGGTGMVYTSNREASHPDIRWTMSGFTRSSDPQLAYAESGTAGSAATFVSDVTGTVVEIAYPGNSLPFTYAIDGGSAVTVTPTGADATEITTVTGLANTTHTVVLTATSSGSVTLLRGTGSLTSGAAKFGISGRAGGAYAIPNGASSFFTAGTPGTLGTGTVECWFRLAATPGSTKVIFGQDTGFWVGINSSGFIQANTGAGAPGTSVVLTGSTNYANNTWHHVALDFDAGKPSVYVDGTRVLTSATAAAPSGTPTYAGLVIGGFGGSGLSSFDWTGDIDEVRVSTVRRYTGTTYTTPTAAFTSDGSTAHLIHFDDATTRIIAANVRKTTGGLEVTNAGRGGTRASDWIASGGTKLLGNILAIDPDIAVVQLDTNEGVTGVTPATFKANMTTLLNALVAAGIPFMLVASPSLDPGGSGYPVVSQATWEALVEASYDLADTFNVPLLDTTHMFVSNATAAADGLMGDLVHPGPVGYRRIAQGIAKVLAS